MKKSTRISLIILTLLSLSGCGDNAYNGETGLIENSIETNSNDSISLSIASLYTLIKENSTNAHTNSLDMIDSINQLILSTDELHLESAQEQFKKLVLSYKRVEAFYIAGYNDAAMKDIADFYIEQFIKHSKSYDVIADLDAVFYASKSIVKNDLKGLTALEYTLFGNQQSSSELLEKMNENRLSSALLMAQNIEERLKSVDEYYKKDTTFLSSNDEAISATLNILVQESYNLRELRIGEAAGFTVKYQDNPSTLRLEYYKSLNSLASIREILLSHQAVMDSGLKNIATLGNSTSEADAILTAIDDALKICDSYSSSLKAELTSAKTQELYEAVRVLQNNYTALINGLNFTQDIIEADGD